MRAMKIQEIAAGVVTFPFRMDGKWLKSGTNLSHEQLARMPTSNRNALQDKGFLYVWPKSALPALEAEARKRGKMMPAGAAERHLQSLGFGRYNVIEGRKLNDKQLGREAAHELAGVKPAKQKSQ